MALAIPRKKKIIRIIVIIMAIVQPLIDEEVGGSAYEQCVRLVGNAEFLMNSWDENEANWTTAQNALWNLIDAIHTAHAPEALSQPLEADYSQWSADLADAISVL